MKEKVGTKPKKDYTSILMSGIPSDKDSDIYKLYDKLIPSFTNQAIYVYSLKEQKMLFAKGWEVLLGYKDEEITMNKMLEITPPKYINFLKELNLKALIFIRKRTDRLKEYSFTYELERIHKKGNLIPLFTRISVFKPTRGKVEEIISISQIISTLKLGEIMQYAAYGPYKSDFEETLNKELFSYYAISKKEKEALILVAKGYAFKEIADELRLSQSAVEKRILPMYKRFNVKGLPHLVSFAYENNLL